MVTINHPGADKTPTTHRREGRTADGLLHLELAGNRSTAPGSAPHHWHIENKLHWVLDVAFREDHCRVCKDYGPENFARLRYLTLTLLKRETSAKVGIKAKRLKAGWDNRYLLRFLRS